MHAANALSPTERLKPNGPNCPEALASGQLDRLLIVRQLQRNASPDRSRLSELLLTQVVGVTTKTPLNSPSPKSLTTFQDAELAVVAVEELHADRPVRNGRGERSDVFAVLEVEPKVESRHDAPFRDWDRTSQTSLDVYSARGGSQGALSDVRFPS